MPHAASLLRDHEKINRKKTRRRKPLRKKPPL